MEKRRYPIAFAWYILGYYCANAAYQGYITVFFQDRGLSTTQIGLVMAFVPVSSMLLQPLWGLLGDRSKNRGNVLRALIACATLSILALALPGGFAFCFAVICVFSASYLSIQPMADSIILESLAAQGQPYGPLRLSGSVFFAVGSLFFGRMLEGNTGFLPYLTAGLLFLTFFSTWSLPSLPGYEKKGEKTSMLAILRLPHIPALMICSLLLQISLGYYYSFFPIRFSHLPGSGTGLLGVAYLISALAEAPFLLLFDRLYKRIGAGRLLCVAAAALAVRWVIMATVDNPYVLLAFQLLHGWSYAVITVSVAKYLSDTLPPALRARGQMLLTIVGYSVARLIANLGGGVIADRLGIANGFYVAAGFAVIALLIFAPIFLRAKPLNGEA